jgi:hypothetical protein
MTKLDGNQFFFLLKTISGNYSYLTNAPTDTISMLLYYENQVGPNKGREVHTSALRKCLRALAPLVLLEVPNHPIFRLG